MKNWDANIISYLLHPLWMPSIGMGIYLHYFFYYKMMLPFYIYIQLVVAACTIFLPLIFIFYFKSTGIISSIHMPTNKERRWPLLIGTFAFFIAYWLLKRVSDEVAVISAEKLYYVAIAGLVTMMVCTIVNLFYKLSIHMAGIAGLLGMIVAYAPRGSVDMLNIILGIVIACGLVGYARLKLNAHSPGQLLIGFIAGFFSQYLVLTFLLR